MPHQCLKCGKIFEDGTPQILKGCSQCGGTKFFFTKQTLTERERKKIIAEVERNAKVLSEQVDVTINKYKTTTISIQIPFAN